MPLDDDWYSAWRALGNDVRPPMRTYTVREVRPEASEFDVDIALHGRIGPASSWALDATPGDEVIVCVPHTGYSGDFHGGVDWRPPADVERLLIAADETALPAVSGIFERLGPDARGVAVVEVPHPDDARALSRPPAGVELIVVARGRMPSAPASSRPSSQGLMHCWRHPRATSCPRRHRHRRAAAAGGAPRTRTATRSCGARRLRLARRQRQERR